MFKPNPLTFRRIVEGDDAEFIIKFDEYQTAVEAFSEECGQMVDSIGQEHAAVLEQMDATLVATGEVYDATVLERQAAEAARQGAEEAEARATQIAVGDVAITALQTGTLSAEKDYVSTDGAGNLVKRNLVADFRAQLMAGTEPASLSRYDLASIATTTTIDFAQGNVFTVQLTGPTTLSLINVPSAPRGQVVKVNLYGSDAVIWDSVIPINWDEGADPEIGENFTRILFDWDGISLSGARSVAR